MLPTGCYFKLAKKVQHDTFSTTPLIPGFSLANAHYQIV